MPMIFTPFVQNLLPVIMAGAGFGLLIAIHECGHFLFAKLFNIGVPAFSLGFGPVLIQTKIGETEFRLSLIPLGGYCAMQYSTTPEEAQANPALNPARDFDRASTIKKTIVMLGGIAFNLAFAYVAFTLTNYGTRPLTKARVTITSVLPGSAAEKAHLKADTVLAGYCEIVSTDGDLQTSRYVEFSEDSTTTQEQLCAFLANIAKHPNEPLSLALQDKSGTPERHDVLLGDKNGVGSLGVSIKINNEEVPGATQTDSLQSAFQKSVRTVHNAIATTAMAIKRMFQVRDTASFEGPLSLFFQTFKSAQAGARELLSFLGQISIMLALMNVLPLGALDGGQLLFVLIEGIIRRQLPVKLKETILLGSWFLFFGLVLVLSYRDIMKFVAAYTGA